MPSIPQFRRIPALPFAAFVIAVLVDKCPPTPGSSIDPRLRNAIFWAFLVSGIASTAHSIFLHNVKGQAYSEAPENQNTSLAVGVAVAAATAAWLLRDDILGAVW